MCSLSEAMSAKIEAVTTQNAAQANKNRTGTRHEESISASATGGTEGTAASTIGADEEVALIKGIIRKCWASPELWVGPPSPFRHEKSNWNAPPPDSATPARSVPTRVGRAGGRCPCLCLSNRIR